jgi:hypothetical protein
MINTTNCTSSTNGCISCPAISAHDAVAPSVKFENALGWNASADSAIALDGDLHVVFAMPKVVGAVCGFRSATSIGEAQPAALDFAFSFSTLSGVLFAQVCERGVTQSEFQYADGDQFEVRRQRGIVTYWYKAATAQPLNIYTSRSRSDAPLIVSACLFATGDSVL